MFTSLVCSCKDKERMSMTEGEERGEGEQYLLGILLESMNIIAQLLGRNRTQRRDQHRHPLHRHHTQHCLADYKYHQHLLSQRKGRTTGKGGRTQNNTESGRARTSLPRIKPLPNTRQQIHPPALILRIRNEMRFIAREPGVLEGFGGGGAGGGVDGEAVPDEGAGGWGDVFPVFGCFPR